MLLKRASYVLKSVFEKSTVLIQNKRFTETSTSAVLNLDSNNILSSPLPDVHGYEKLLHECVWENVHKWPNKTALECAMTGKFYTYHQLQKLTKKLVASLRKSKLQTGDTIAVILPNFIEFCIILLAASESGLKTTLLNPSYTKEEIKFQLHNSDASAVFTFTEKYKEANDIIANNPKMKLPIILVTDKSIPLPEGAINFEDLIKDDVEAIWSSKTNIDSENTVLLPYSSGTTGFPKGVELSHRNVVANIYQTSSKDILSWIDTTDTQQDVIPLILPMFHIYGLSAILLKHLRLGAKLVCLPKFSNPGFFQLLDTHKSTILYVVPPLVHLLAHDEQLKPHHTEAVRTIVSGAAPLGAESIAKLRSKINSDTRIIQGYGLSETSPVISLNENAPSEASGYPVPNTQIRIVSHEGENIGKNSGVKEIGELWVRGPQVMKKYFKNEKATKETYEGDWFKTGDLAYYDEKGAIYIEGRTKELIKVKGFQVAPAELEELIRKLDKVQDVAVVGVKHDRYGEIPKAFVVPKKGTEMSEEEVKDFIAERVSKHKHLGHVQFIDKIPVSASGKILRRLLENY